MLLYGLGSKYYFVGEIKKCLEKRIPILEIQGFIPSLNFRVIV
jgi:hypothetical protein